MTVRLEDRFPFSAWPRMRDFLRRNYWPHLALLDPRVFRWTFRVRDEGDGETAHVLTAWDGDRLVGMLGYMPVTLLWGDPDRAVPGAACANWVVDEAYRGSLGWTLLRRLSELYSVVIGIGGKTQTLQIAERLGWMVDQHLPRLVAVLDGDRAARVAGAHADRDELERMAAGVRPCVDPAVRFSEQPPPVESDWAAYPPLHHAVLRSAEYFRHRFVDHPIFEHRFAVLGPANRPAVCVWREQLAYGDCQETVARLLEFFHPSDADGQAAGRRLMCAVLARLKAEGCAYTDLHMSSVAYRDTLDDCGWHAETFDHQLLPGRVCPVERTHRVTNFIGCAGDGFGMVPLADMYMTGADGDEDRAAMAPDLLAPVQPGIPIRISARRFHVGPD